VVNHAKNFFFIGQSFEEKKKIRMI
jgi:hypothetical protein